MIKLNSSETVVERLIERAFTDSILAFIEMTGRTQLNKKAKD